MTDQRLIQFLWDHGHFWNPKYPQGRYVQEEELDKLTLNDQVVQLAVLSFQELDANLVPLVGAHHRRAPIYDGLVGPATRQLAELPRCSVPDFPPPDKAKLGVGSWPSSGCDPEAKGRHSIRVSIDWSGANKTVRDYSPQALQAVVAAYRDVGLSVRYTDGNTQAEIVKSFEHMSFGIIGWNYFPNPGTCSKIDGRLASNYVPSMELWANLECHETGHGVGLPHTRGSIMNPSILLTWPLTWRGSPSYPALKDYFGGEPFEPPAPPPVPPTVPTDRAVKWLKRMYQDLLNRPMADTEVPLWQPHLHNKHAVVARILGSREYNENVAKAIYRTFLRREPDGGGLDHFTNLLATGIDIKDILTTVLTSPEYIDKA